MCYTWHLIDQTNVSRRLLMASELMRAFLLTSFCSKFLRRNPVDYCDSALLYPTNHYLYKKCFTYTYAFKITADGDCSHEINRCLLLGRKVMINLDSILKSRDITLSTKVGLVKAMVFQWTCMDVRVGL